MSSAAISAEAIVGRQGSMDWDLKPEKHAAILGPEAGPLRRILQRSELQEIMAGYRVADANAKAAQRRYRRLAVTAALTGFAVVALGGVRLLPLDDVLPKSVALSLSILQFALLAVSILSSLALALLKPFDTWMHERAKAETSRIALFKSVLAADEAPSAAELPAWPLKLEYFRRYQLDVQRAYYLGRGAEHARAVKRASTLRVLALLLVGIAGLPLAFSILGLERVPAWMSALLDPLASPEETTQRILLCASVLGGGLQGLLASYSLLSQSERNATRYLDTARNLDDLSARPLEEARAAALAGEAGPVLAFAALVHEQISSEHREWIALRTLVPDLALGKLKAVHLPNLK